MTENDLKKSIVDGVLLVPLEPNIQKTRAILEFSGFHGSCDKSHSLDYEYFAILARAVLGDILAKINQKVLNSQESKLQDFFQMALIDLCTSESDYQFSEKIKNWVSRLFNVSISNFYFYTNELLIKHFTASNFEEIGEIGVVGKCSKGLKPLLTPNLKNSPHFDGKVDLSTLMTVLTFPIIEKNTLGEKKCLGVIQIPIKESAFMGKNMEFGEVRPDLEKLGQFFGEITELALRYYRRSWG